MKSTVSQLTLQSSLARSDAPTGGTSARSERARLAAWRGPKQGHRTRLWVETNEPIPTMSEEEDDDDDDDDDDNDK